MSEPVEIHVLDKRVRLLQPQDGFRTSLDSVMLAAACPARAGDHILDMGCGVGGAGFCVLTRVSDTKLTGVDIQSDHVDLARQNIELNDRQGRAEFIVADIRDFSAPNAFDHVICNPPYMEAGTFTPSASVGKTIAHAHTPSPHRGEGRGEGAREKPSADLIDRARELRHGQTKAELKLWEVLRNRQFLNLKFKRQFAIPPYIVDFVCLERRIVIELDGAQHADQKAYDDERTAFLEDQGYKVLRFWNKDILQNMDGIYQVLETEFLSPSPNPLPKGRGLESPTLDDWLDAGFRALKSGGALSMIHRADRTDKIILGLKNRFGALEIIPLWPRAGENAKRVIIRAVKDRKTPAMLHTGIILHEADGTYTATADAILRDMQPIV